MCIQLKDNLNMGTLIDANEASKLNTIKDNFYSHIKHYTEDIAGQLLVSYHKLNLTLQGANIS